MILPLPSEALSIYSFCCSLSDGFLCFSSHTGSMFCGLVWLPRYSRSVKAALIVAISFICISNSISFIFSFGLSLQYWISLTFPSVEGMWLSLIPSSLLNQNYSVLKALFSDYNAELSEGSATSGVAIAEYYFNPIG